MPKFVPNIREQIILVKAKQFMRAKPDAGEIDSFFVFNFDPYWIGSLIAARETELGRETAFDRNIPQERNEGLIWEQRCKQLEGAYRFEHGQKWYIGKLRDEEEQVKEIDGKFYECKELDTSIPFWFDGIDSQEWVELQQKRDSGENIQPFLDLAYKRGFAEAEKYMNLTNAAWRLAIEFGVLPEDALRALLWNDLPPSIRSDYLLIESHTKPTFITIFRYGKNDGYPTIRESESRIALQRTPARKKPLYFPTPFNPNLLNPNPFAVEERRTMQDFLSEAIERQGRTIPRTSMVRIRTWAIYRLTKRGGGRLSEMNALRLWELLTGSGIEIGDSEWKTFQRDRDAMFLTDTLRKTAKTNKTKEKRMHRR